MTIKRFEDLEIWQMARALCKRIIGYSQTTSLSKDFSLKDQILRSSGSCMDCIAEGFERDGTKEFLNLLSISKGSIGETRSQVYRCYDANHFTEEIYTELIKQCVGLSTKIRHFMDYLKNSGYDGTKRKP
jgi:four helix bundle protein